MKAFILAGGYATRLRPLSCQKPKLLFPIAGKPILERTIETLKTVGIDEVVLAVNFLADDLKSYFKSEYSGVKIRYSRETTPLGTAGPLKKAEKILKDSDSFFVFNGDILFEGNLKEMITRHQKTNAVATIALKEVENPSRFGVVVYDHDMQVHQFIEKPKKEDAPSNFINAGIYMMSPEIFDYIPSRKKFSTEKSVFPILATEKKLFAYNYQGVWFDIGAFEDFRLANKYYLEKIALKKPFIQGKVSVNISSDLMPPVLVGHGSTIEDNVCIGPYSIIGARNTIKRGSVIEDSILFDDVHIGENSVLKGCILGDGVIIENNVKVGEKAILADGVTVNSGVEIPDDTHICPHKEINADIMKSNNI